MNLTAGTALQGGKYILNQTVGGSRSFTFKATQTQQNRSVVLKTPNLEAARDAASLKQQWMEKVRALSQCRHPALTAVLDWFEEGGLPFVVMDCVPGQPLADRVTSRGPLTEPEALQYVRQVGSALSLLHRQGLVHQDIKPSNLIQPIGSNLVVLVDFGLVELAGTPGFAGQKYAAIEQFQSKPVSPATDIYALAASLYFLLTGQAPIAAPLRHHTPLVPPQQLRQVSPAVATAILAGLELNPAARPQTIAAWFSLLEGKALDSAAPGGQAPSPMAAQAAGQTTGQTAVELPALTVLPANGQLPPAVPPRASATQAVSPNGQLPAAQASQSPHLSFNGNQAAKGRAIALPQRRIPRAFVVGSALAGLAGVGLGLVLRVSGGTGPGSTFFHTEQAFPKLKDSANASPPVEEKFPPAASEPPAAKTYVPAPAISAPSGRVPPVDRAAPAEVDPIPVEPKASPRLPVSEPAPVPSPLPSIDSAPRFPAPPSEPAPPAFPVPTNSAPPVIPAPPAAPPVRQP